MSRDLIKHISGEHVDLVDIEPAFFRHVVAWRNDPDNRRCFFTQDTWTIEGQRQWYHRYKTDPADLTFVILLKPAIPVGMVALYNIDEWASTAEFGRLLVGEKTSRRHGIAFEASALCLALAFETLKLRQVYLEVHDWNTPAIRLYERLGFVTIAHTEKPAEQEGEGYRARRMTLDKEGYDSCTPEGTKATW